MKIKFDPNLDYQQEAIEAVCSVFKGQETLQTTGKYIQNPDGKQTLSSHD